MNNSIYIFVRGGVVQGVRAARPIVVHVIDYDNLEDMTDEELERDVCGQSFAEIEAATEAIY